VNNEAAYNLGGKQNGPFAKAANTRLCHTVCTPDRRHSDTGPAPAGGPRTPPLPPAPPTPPPPPPTPTPPHPPPHVVPGDRNNDYACCKRIAHQSQLNRGQSRGGPGKAGLALTPIRPDSVRRALLPSASSASIVIDFTPAGERELALSVGGNARVRGAAVSTRGLKMKSLCPVTPKNRLGENYVAVNDAVWRERAARPGGVSI